MGESASLAVPGVFEKFQDFAIDGDGDKVHGLMSIPCVFISENFRL